MSNTFTMPLGPVHVALEEPVYFHLTVDGETVRNVELTSGHVHRGMEAMATQRNLVKNVTLTERVCSLCSNSHSFTYAMVVENALGIKISERAKYLRSMTEEIKRMASHLFNIAMRVGDFPITPPQRHHIVAAIENRDVIAKHIIVFSRIALLCQITRLNRNFYIIHPLRI